MPTAELPIPTRAAAPILAVRRLGCVVALALLAGGTPVPAATLTVLVGNVRNDRGRVHVDLCTEATFLKQGCPYSADAPARSGVVRVTVRDVPPGRYAAQVFHDENGNGKVDRVLFGLPREGVGFSNDALKHLSPPKWADAVFAVTGPEQTIRLRMRYFLGASGPGR